MTTRVLLLGGGGCVGQTLAHMVPSHWTLSAPTRAECDIANPAMLRGAFQRLSPDIVINAAGLVSVDEAERDHAKAVAVNFDAVAHMAALCSVRDVPLVQLSTDHVFDGEALRPYTPSDTVTPVNAYGESKMLGEDALRHELAWHTILRTSCLIGAVGNNVLTRMIEQIRTQKELRQPTDLVSCPTPVEHLAEGLIVIADKIMKGVVGGFGTFHLCGTPAVSRHELAEAALAAAHPWLANPPSLTATVSAERADQAPRPRYTALDCSTTLAVFGIEQKPWKDSLAASVKTLLCS